MKSVAFVPASIALFLLLLLTTAACSPKPPASAPTGAPNPLATELSAEDAAALAAAEGKAETPALGKSVFVARCAACHGIDGGGGVGPNLTDRYWLHGRGALSEIYRIARDGFPEKGMPPWKGIIPDEEIRAAAIFAKGLQGTKPGTPKSPQGVEIK